MWQSSLPLPLLLTLLACLVWNILQVSWNIFIICYLWILSTLLYWLWDWDTILGCHDTCLNRFKITKTFNLLRFIDWGLDFNSAIYLLAISQYMIYLSRMSSTLLVFVQFTPKSYSRELIYRNSLQFYCIEFQYYLINC